MRVGDFLLLFALAVLAPGINLVAAFVGTIATAVVVYRVDKGVSA